MPKLVYTHQNSMMVGLIKSKLENEGLEVVIKNDIASGAAGELAPMDLWPEVWVVQECDISKAKSIIADMESEGASMVWNCDQCGEGNDGSFELCWHCQSARA